MFNPDNAHTIQQMALRASMTARQPVMLVGDPGTSKTATIQSIAQEMGYDLIPLIASRMDPQDLSGFPTKGEYVDEDGARHAITEYAPQFWQKQILDKKKVILFLDEFGNAHPSVRASMLSLIQDRQFPNGDKFPAETIIVGAMNPTESGADGYELDRATTNRMHFIAWSPTVDEWLKGMAVNWGRETTTTNESRWRNLIVRFIKDERTYLHNMDTSTGSLNHDSDSERVVAHAAWASRRSWDNLARVLGALETTQAEVEDYIAEGIVGAKASAAFRSWIKKHGKLNIAEILKDPDAFEGWDTLELDDVNVLVRSAVDSIDPNSKTQEIRNVITVFNKIHDANLASMVGAHIQDYAQILRNNKTVSESDKAVLRGELMESFKKYQPFIRENNSKK